MRTSGINHVSVHANDLDASVRFYVELLDAVLLDTPNFGLPVQWLGARRSAAASVRPRGGAASHHHFGITVEDLEPVYRRAEAMDAFDRCSYKHHLVELPGDVAQTYVRDPAGNLMEIDTPGASRLPEELRAQMKRLDELYPQDEVNRRARLYVRTRRRTGRLNLLLQAGGEFSPADHPGPSSAARGFITASGWLRPPNASATPSAPAGRSSTRPRTSSPSTGIGARVDVIATKTLHHQADALLLLREQGGALHRGVGRAYGKIREREQRARRRGPGPRGGDPPASRS